MRIAFSAVILATLPVLSACNSTGLATFPAASRAGTVQGSEVQASLSSETNRAVTRGSVGTAAYVIGVDQNRGQVVGVAGYRGANVGSAVTSGRATYTTDYSIAVAEDVRRDDTHVRWDQGREDGTMYIVADFDNGTVDGRNYRLDVSATIDGTDMDGSVQVLLPTGTIYTDLTGEIGSTGLIGAFHGADTDAVAVGGLVGTRN